MRKFLFLLLLPAFFIKTAIAQVPDVTLTDCNGINYNIYEDLAAGNAVVLKFCAGWCVPCNISNPLYESVWNGLKNSNCKVKMYSMLFETENAWEATDCNYGQEYASKYGLTMPMITNIGLWNSGITGQFASLYNMYAIPTTIIILPNQSDPANSIVKVIVGTGIFDEATQTMTWLDQVIRDSLASGGFYSPKFNIEGSLCSDPPYSLTLSSATPTGNLWSTGAISQSIPVTEPGEYSLTVSPGCTYSEQIEFTAIPVPGTASISSPVVCQDGEYTLSYAVPPGSPDDIIWVYRSAGESEWFELTPADGGPVTFATGNYYPAGTSLEFAVRVKTENGVCTVFSNVVSITVTDVQPGTLTGTVSSTATNVCFKNDFILSYAGGVAGASWVYLNDFDYWEFFASADQPVNPNWYILLNERNTGSDKFRVRYLDGNCYSYSEIIEVNYFAESLEITGFSSTCPGTGNMLGLNGNYTDILWSTGASTASIFVNPSATTTFTVTATDVNGCVNSDEHTVNIVQEVFPGITMSAGGTICGSGAVTLSFAGTNIASPCTEAPYGQWPSESFTNSFCDGNAEIITNDGWLGEFSLVEVVTGNYYKFYSQAEQGYEGAIINTIKSRDGSEVYASGIFNAVWKATVTGPVVFITSGNDCEANNVVSIQRSVACSADASAFGTFAWLPGAQTTPSITVSPATTTNYTLTFSQPGATCFTGSTKQVVVGVESLVLSTTNITCTSATFNWATPFDPTVWELEYKSVAKGSKWMKMPVTSTGSRSAIITGLKQDQNYQWHIRAKCGRASTSYSDAVSFNTLSDCGSTRSTMGAEKEMDHGKLKAESLNMLVMPNPSNTNFRIVISSDDLRTPVQMIVTDIIGRRMETRIVTAGQHIVMGEGYKSGSYIVQLIQGKETKQIKLVKISH